MAPLAVLVAAGGRVAVVGGIPRFVEPSPVFGVVLAVSAVTAIASGLAALAGGARLVLDHIDGRPLSARLAVTAVLRRPRAFAMLVIVFVPAVAVLVAIGAALAASAESVVPAVIVVTAAGVTTLPLMIAWAALTDGVPPLRTTWRLISRGYGEAVWTLALGYLAVPVLLHLGLFALGGLLPAPTDGLFRDAARLAATVLQTPLQAAAVGCCYARLQRLEPATVHGLDREEGHDRGNERVGRRRWWPIVAWPAVLLVALLPGLLYGGYAAEPLSWARTVDNEIGVKEEAVDYPSRTEIMLGPGGKPVVFRDERRPVAVFCGDDTCGDHVSVTLDEHFRTHPATVVAPDGSLVVAGWTDEIGASRMELVMFSCRPDGCIRRPGEPLATEETSDARAAAVATPHGLAIAWSARLPGRGKKPLSRVVLALCDDVACARRRVVPVGDIVDSWTLEDMDARVLAVAASPDGRPVVAYTDRGTHKLTVASCESAACAHPSIHAFDLPALTRYTWLTSNLRTQVAVRPDGRPVVVYSDPGDGHTSTVLLCSDPACSGTPRFVPVPEVVAVSAPGLALDAQGLPLLAGYRRKGAMVIDLVACRDQDCARRSASPLLPAGGVGQFDLAIGSDQRPRILWYGTADPAGDNAYHLLTCADPHCAP
ncbi:hypothetical protein AAH991_11895 [Microbispora sp. ZYX-F-249]|uniref:Integral membrane protein n=1 Tax=Microbispora maris TaxID=3144104 RepID=A0ABV0AKH7_9ACTN